jgi:hypothetical protein
MMSRIADVLEREGRSVDLEPGDFERLLGRRERKQRNRRIRAGAVGVIVALAMGIILVRSLTSDGVPADQPPAPAASGTLAYALDGDIYVADPDGSNAVKIADGAAECAGHSEYWAEGSMWSPDGRYLAYRYSDCSSGPEWLEGVVISDAEGNVLARFPTGRGWEIRWSPDSTRVAVWDSFAETIGVYWLDGARQTQLTVPPGWQGCGDTDPHWMPDGTSLWVCSVELPLDGGTPQQLPSSHSDACSSEDVCSPDGSHFAYVDHRSLIVARSDGSGSVTLLTVEHGTILGAIGFSQQGDRILFSRREAGESSLWSIGVDGSDPRLVVAGAFEGEWLLR